MARPGVSEQRFDQAMAALIHERWEEVWKAIPAAVEGSDLEGVHDVRVASRRLRAAMDIASDAFPPNWYKPLHRVAKLITSELGEVRDRDVQIAYLEEARKDAEPGDQPGVERLIARLESERSEARTHMVTFLQDLEERSVREEVNRRFGGERVR